MTSSNGTDIGVKQRFLNYTQETTLHGINHVTDTNRNIIQRTVWLFLYLTAAGAFLFYLVTGLLRFYTYPVATKLDYVLESNLEFPSVTICNINPIRQSYIDEQNDPKLNLAASLLNPIVARSVDWNAPAIKELESWKMDWIGPESAHLREKMFMACSFMSGNYSELPCKFSDELLVPRRTQIGFCYTFQPQEYVDKYGPLVSSRAGSGGGLFFSVKLQQEEYAIGMSSAGLKVIVHDPKTEPLVHDLGSSIHPGMSTNLVITKVKLDNLPSPYEGSVCINTNPERNSSFRNPLEYYEHYSFSACKLECRYKYILRECGCVAYFSLDASVVPICDILILISCVFPATRAYYANSSIEAACDCFRPCEETQYTVTQSSAYFPADSIVPMLEEAFHCDEDYMRRNTLELMIYYGELGYTKISQKPDYPSNSLFAEVGGLCGLFLGASLLTLTEFCEVLVMVLSSFCNCKPRATKVQQIRLDVKNKF